MSFKIKVDDKATFEWKNNKLYCDDEKAMRQLKHRLVIHIPTVVIMPDMIDYDDDLTDGRNAYYAITGSFPDHEVLEEPSEDFLFSYFDENVIY